MCLGEISSVCSSHLHTVRSICGCYYSRFIEIGYFDRINLQTTSCNKSILNMTLLG